MTPRQLLAKLSLDKVSGLYLLVLFIVVFGALTPNLFLTHANLESLASQQTIIALLAIAVLMPLAAGVYDLSIGATVNLSAVVVVILQTQNHMPMGLAIVLAIACGVVIGLINGFIVVVLHVDSFIATLGTATLIGAFQQIDTGQSQPVPPITSTWIAFTQTDVLGFQVVVYYLLFIALIAWWLLDHTPAGRYMYAAGGNAEAARLSGVRVGVYQWASLIWCGLISGVAGVLYSSLIGPSLSFGSSMLLPAYAAVFLGATQFKPGRVNIWGTFLAVFLLATGVKGLQYLTSVQWLSSMFDGGALIVAVSFAVWRQRHAGRPTTRPDQSDSTLEPPPDSAVLSLDGVVRRLSHPKSYFVAIPESSKESNHEK
jgi:ribose transport system permease protein